MRNRRFYLNNDERLIVQRKVLSILEELDEICRRNNIKYTIAYGTLLGAIRHKGFIPWDDDVDVCMLRSEYVKFKEICRTQLSDRFFYQSFDTDEQYFRVYDKIRINDTLFLETAHANRKIHQGLYLDIFPVDAIPDNVKIRKKHLRNYSFFHTITGAKYISIKSRAGTKKLFAILIRILTFFIPLKLVFKKTIAISTKYNKAEHCLARNYDTPYGINDLFPVTYFEDIIDVEFEGVKVMASAHYDEMLNKIYGDYMTLPPKEKRKTQHDLLDIKL